MTLVKNTAKHAQIWTFKKTNTQCKNTKNILLKKMIQIRPTHTYNRDYVKKEEALKYIKLYQIRNTNDGNSRTHISSYTLINLKYFK